jgi:hypothetical protein
MPESKTSFTWEAPEFKKYNRSFWWYLALLLITTLLTSYQIYIDDKFGAFTTVTIAVLIVIFTHQQPKTVAIRIEKSGVSIGESSYPYSHFKYFWIVDDGHHKSLNLEANTYFSQTVIIELLDQDASAIREFLLDRLLEAEGLKASFSQKISRRLKL